MLVLLALVCTIVFPPLGFLVSAGGALYAHRVGNFGLRNVLLAFFVALVVLLGVLQTTATS
jgi:ABC-type multidrug transport system permease subunit